MTASDTTFYAIVATVIPVLLLAYLVNTRILVTRFLRWQIYKWLHRRVRGQRFPPFRVTLAIGAGQCLLLVLSVLPALGEALALRALATDSVAPATEAFVVIGLVVSGCAVLGPILYAASGMEALAPIYWALWQIADLRREHHAGKLSTEDFLAKSDELADQAGLPKGSAGEPDAA